VSNQRPAFAQLLPITLASLVVVADRLTKIWIQRSMTIFDAVPVIPGWLRIVHTENPGAAFGVLSEGNALLRGAILIGVSTLVLAFVASALWSRKSAFTATATRAGLSLILGGAIGNLFDRIVRGTVTDFIEVYHASWSFPAFNVADSAITVGAVLLLLDLLLQKVGENASVAHK
jgi:signal peptidase II